MKTTIKALTPEWFEWRRTRITATDWAPLLIPDDKRPSWMATPLSIWERITGRTPPEDPSTQPWLEWGLWAEHMAAPWYASVTGRTVERLDVLWTADAGPGAGDLETAWMGCTLDGETVDKEKDEGSWECKATGYQGSKAWESGEGGYVVPLHYQIQQQGQMACTGHQWGAVCNVTWPTIYYGDVPRKDHWIERAWERIDRFWRVHIQGDTPPEPTAADGDARILRRMHDPRANEVQMEPHIERICEDIELLEADVKAKGHRAKKLRNDLRDWMRRKGARKTVNAARTMAWQFGKDLRRAKP